MNVVTSGKKNQKTINRQDVDEKRNEKTINPLHRDRANDEGNEHRTHFPLSTSAATAGA